MGQRGECVDHGSRRHLDASTPQLVDENLDAADQRVRRLGHRFANWVSMSARRFQESGQDDPAQLPQCHRARAYRR